MKSYPNNIELTSGFTFNANKPLDDRIVVDSVEDLYSVDSDRIYDEMIVSVRGIGPYRYSETDEQWHRIYDASETYNKEEINAKTNNIIHGSFGTTEMQEGDALESGKIYIQYDE